MTPKKTKTAAAPSAIERALGAKLGAVDDPSALIDAVLDFANGDVRPSWKPRVSAVSEGTLEMWAKMERDSADFWTLRIGIAKRSGNQQEEAEANAEAARYTALADGIEAAQRSGRWWPPTFNDPEKFSWEYTIDQTAAKRAGEAWIDTERELAVLVLDGAALGKQALLELLLKAPELLKSDFDLAVHMVPRVQVSKTSATLKWIFSGDSSDSWPWVRFAAIYLAAHAPGDRTDIGRCRLESCRRFFRIDWSAGHRPRTEYCCPEHRVAYHNQHATDRKRKSRSSSKQPARQPGRAKW